LTPLDFFFWEVCKDTVYHEKMQNVNEIYNRLIKVVECITNEMLANTW